MTNDLAALWSSLGRRLLWLSCWGGIGTAGAVDFRVTDGLGSVGEVYEAEVRVSDFTVVQAFQFSLSWDASILRFSEVDEFSLPGLGANNFGVFQSEGHLSVIWDSTRFDGESMDGDALLFRLNFEVLGEDGASTMIDFGDTPTRRLVVQDLSQGVFRGVPGAFVVGRPPQIEGIAELTLSEDQASDPIPLVFSDDVTAAFELGITVASSNPSLIPDESVQLTGDGAERSLLLVPLADQSGQSDITIRAVDESGGETIHVLSLTVIAVNDPPQALDDELVVDEDAGPVEVAVLANDVTLPDFGDTLTLEFVTTGSNGGRTEILGNLVVYEPAPDFNGTESFGYVVRDEGGLSANGGVTVTVNPVNDPPTLTPDFVEVPEDEGDTRVLVLENDTSLPDVDEVLRVTGVSDPDQGGVVSLREGQVFYRPAANFFGLEAFGYTVADGNGGIAEGRVEIQVTAVNDPPHALDDGVSVPEDSSDVFIPVLENDHSGPDRDETLAVLSVTSASSGGQVRVEGNGLFYSSAPNFFGTETFEYTIGDGNGGMASAKVTVTVVNDRADAPVARDDHFTVPEDSVGNTLLVLVDNGNGRDFDPDGDALSVIEVTSVDGDPDRLDVAIGGQAIFYSPASDFVGSETLSYVVSDGENTSVGFVFVTVSDANNDPPRARPDALTVNEDSAQNRLNVLEDNGFGADVDPEGSPLSVTNVPGAGPLNGTVGVSDDGLALIYTPLPNFSGMDQMHYFVSDGSGQSRGVVDVTVLNVDNDPPLARADHVVLTEDVPDQRVDVLGDNGSGPDFDPEGGDLLIASVILDEGQDPRMEGTLVVGADQRNLFFSPPQNFVGEAAFLYTIHDGTHDSSAKVTVQVENVDDDPPSVLDDRFEVDEGASEASLRVLGSVELGFDEDPEGEPLLVVGVSMMGSRGGHVRVGPLQQTVLYTPLPDFVGEETFDYQVSDGKFTSTGAVVVRVRNTDNDPPVVKDDQFEVPEDAIDWPLMVLEDNGAGVDFDPEGMALEVVRVEPVGMAVGRVQIADGGRTILYTPRENFFGEEAFLYRVTDGHGEAEAVLSIRVQNSDNDPPVARDDQFFALEDVGVIELKVLEDQGAGPDFDPDGDSLTIVMIPDETEGSSQLTLDETRKVILYTSAADFFGADRFRYSISDGTHVVDATVTVLVTRGGNDAPLARDDHFTIAEDSINHELKVLLDQGSGADTDPDGDPLRVVAVHGPASNGGEVVLQAGGDTVVYTPVSDFHGEETFGYTVSDGQLTSTAEVVVTVTPIPDAPQILPVADVEVDQGTGSVQVIVSVTDVDSDFDSLTFSVRSGAEDVLAPNEIEWFREAEGWRILLTPDPLKSGQVTVVMHASDGELDTQASFRFKIREQVELLGGVAGGSLRGGRVFVDLDHDGEWAEGEPHGELSMDGSFRFTVGLEEIDRNQDGILSYLDGHLVIQDGIDRRSGLPMLIQIRAPLGVSLISPFSTLVSAVLDAGLVFDLDGATNRARHLIGLIGDGFDGKALLSLDPYEGDETIPPVSLELQHRLSALEAMTSQISRLLAPVVFMEPGEVSAQVMRVMAASEAAFMSDCSQVDRLLRRVLAGMDATLSDEKFFLARQILCVHLDWISKIEQGALSPVERTGRLRRLHLFSEFEMGRDLRLLGATPGVPEILSFRYSVPEFELRVTDYFSIGSIENNQMPGVLRFLRSSARVGEDGGDFEMPALVREGGSRGELNAAILVSGITATPVSDYAVQPLLVTFQDGELIQSLDLSEVIRADDQVEGEEVAEVRLFYGDEVDENGNSLIRDRLRLVIEDADSPNRFEFSNPSFEVDEGFKNPAVFVFRRGDLRSPAAVSVRMEELNRTLAAASGVDFSDAPVKVFFEPGARIQGVVLPVIEDFLVEDDELVGLNLMLGDEAPDSSTLGSIAESILTIRNDDFDRMPLIEAIPDQEIDEGQSITVAFTVTDDVTALGDLRIEAMSHDLNLVTVQQIDRNPLNDRFSIRLQSVENAFGLGVVEIRVSDPFQTVSHSFSIRVNAVNDRPALVGTDSNPLVYVENALPLPIAPGIDIEDLDDANLMGATIGFSVGFQPGEDRLIFADGNDGIRSEYHAESGLLRLSGVASVEDYRRAIRRVLYENRSDDPSESTRSIVVSVRDGELESEFHEIPLLVESVNDPPSLVRVESLPLDYVENSPPIPVSNTLLVEAVEDENYFEASVRIVGPYVASEDRLVAEPVSEGLVVEPFDVELGILRISGEGSWEDYQSAFRAVGYHNLSENPSEEARHIEFRLRDSEQFGDAVSRVVRVVSVNDPPVFGGLADLAVSSGESVSLTFQLTDVDSEVGLPLVTVGSSNPSLVVASSVRVSRGEAGFVLDFETREGELGEATINLSARDGEDQAVRAFSVMVGPRHIAPSVVGPDRVVVQEDEPVSIRFQIEDQDSAQEDLSFQIHIDDLSLFRPGSLQEVREGATLEIRLVPVPDAFGATVLSLDVSDAEQNVRTSVEIDILSVNDLPSVSGLQVFEIESGESLEFDVTLGDVETPVDQLLVGVRPADPAFGGSFSVQVQGRGDERRVQLEFEGEFHGIVPLELVVVDGDAGVQVAPFEVVVEEKSPESPRLAIARLPNGTLELRWDGGGRLAVADKLDGTFLIVPRAISPFPLRPEFEQAFFKIVD